MFSLQLVIQKYNSEVIFEGSNCQINSGWFLLYSTSLLYFVLLMCFSSRI